MTVIPPCFKSLVPQSGIFLSINNETNYYIILEIEQGEPIYEKILRKRCAGKNTVFHPVLLKTHSGAILT